MYTSEIIDSQKPQTKILNRPAHFLAIPLRFSILNDVLEIRLRFGVVVFFFRQFSTDSVIFHAMKVKKKTTEKTRIVLLAHQLEMLMRCAWKNEIIL